MRLIARIALTLTGVAALAMPATAGAATSPSVKGFYAGRTIRYLDFGPIHLAPGNAVASLWTVTNGTTRQHNIVDAIPGDRAYSPLWSIHEVTWKAGATPRTLKSLADVRAARAAGEVTVRSTSTV